MCWARPVGRENCLPRFGATFSLPTMPPGRSLFHELQRGSALLWCLLKQSSGISRTLQQNGACPDAVAKEPDRGSRLQRGLISENVLTLYCCWRATPASTNCSGKRLEKTPVRSEVKRNL